MRLRGRSLPVSARRDRSTRRRGSPASRWSGCTAAALCASKAHSPSSRPWSWPSRSRRTRPERTCLGSDPTLGEFSVNSQDPPAWGDPWASLYRSEERNDACGPRTTSRDHRARAHRALARGRADPGGLRREPGDVAGRAPRRRPAPRGGAPRARLPARPRAADPALAPVASRGVLAAIPSPHSGLVHVGPLLIHMYGLMLLLGIAAATWLTGIRWVRWGGDWDLIFRCAVGGVAGGIVGARLYHDVTTCNQVPSQWWGPF